MIDLRLGDCLKILPTLEAGSVDAVITDPPYLTTDSQVPIRGSGVAKLNIETNSVGNPWGFSLDWIDEVAKLSPKQWVIFCNFAMLGQVYQRLHPYAKVMALFVWRKRNAPHMTRPVPRLDCEFIIWARAEKASCERMGEFSSLILDVAMPQAGCFATERILCPESGKAAHPCQKPIAVISPFVDRLTKHHAVIIDPFMGSGTTGVACVNLGRSFIGIEKDPAYFAIAEKRITQAQQQLRLEVLT